VLLASSEVHPYSKTGGLADMSGALARALAQAGHRVGIATPLYQGVRERFSGLRRLEMPLEFPLGLARYRGEVWTLDPQPGLTVYFIDQPEFYQRSSLYHAHGVDYPDNAQRFLFFSKAVTGLSLELEWKPQVLHLHDWQTSFAALFIEHQRLQSQDHAGPATCVTIHNLAYQGQFPAGQYALANLPWTYFTPQGVEFYGKVNCLKAGIAFADVITAVSPRYAREIMTEQFGCGLDGLLRGRQDAVFGILNGVDYDEWNPAKDAFIPHPYSLEDLAGKQANKLELQKELGLTPDPNVPLFGNIGRLVEQKGADIMVAALEEMLGANLQLALLGTGSAAFEQAWQGLAQRYPGRAVVRIGFDEGLSHRIEAGCDFFLMPSCFEPCGLNQMYGLRYGTVPIVRATGGLDDTVVDPREDPQKADGIKFSEYSASALAKAIRKALALYAEPEAMAHFRVNGMKADFSWARSAGAYVAAYEAAIKRRLGSAKSGPKVSA
jgi:starch synthase